MKYTLTYLSLPIGVLMCILYTASPVDAKEITISFTSQAPYSDWREPWYNACEETSIAMVHTLYTGTPLTTKAQAKTQIQAIFSIKNTFIGESLDEPAELIASLINDFLPWEAEVLENPTLEELKKEIDANQPVILPVSAPLLQNPHFQGVFPYHVIVLSGYDDTTEEFIAQEPGTRFGKNYRYSYDTIERAIRDFRPTNMDQAPRRVVLTRNTVSDTAQTDGDGDGLTKEQEILYKSSLTNIDTDGDGYSDGTEVTKGYSPIYNEKKIPNGSVVKAPGASTVFLYSNGTLSSFANERAFLSRGYTWSQILPISTAYRDLQKRGSVLY